MNEGLNAVELTVVMPCLNEAETIATCVRKAKGYIESRGIKGEVLVADNGSTDGSQAIDTPSLVTPPTCTAPAIPSVIDVVPCS